MKKSDVTIHFLILFFISLPKILSGQADTTNNINIDQIQQILTAQYDSTKPKVERTLYSALNRCYEFKDSIFTGSDTINPFDDFKRNFDIKVVRYYEKGKKVRAEGYDSLWNFIKLTEFDGFVKHGWQKEWYSDGKLESVSYYNKGQNELPNLFFYNDGSLRSIAELNENKNIFKAFYANGILKNISINLDSCETGELIKLYHENGALEMKMLRCTNISYIEGFYSNRQLAYKYESELMTPIRLMQQWYRNGTKKLEGNIVRSTEYLLDRQLDGEWFFWNEKGKLVMKRLYKNGKLLKEKRYGKVDVSFFEKCIFPDECQLD